MTRMLVSLGFLTLIYALVLASFHPWDLLSGVVISGMLLLAFRQFLFGGWPEPLSHLFGRVLAFVPFAVMAIRDVLVGTWDVALVVLHFRPLACPGIVAVPIGDRTPNGVAVSALVITLSPGSVLVNVDWERRVILFHLLDASDPDRFRAACQKFYRRYQQRVFP